MAGFKTHITTSTALGIAYGTTACTVYDVQPPACILAAGLCGVSGMLPDLDSASGVPKRESIAFAAAVVPLLLAERLKQMPGMDPEYIVLAGGAIYLFIRFVLAKILTHFTIHRGMFHSFPACLIAGEIAFLLCGHEQRLGTLLQRGRGDDRLHVASGAGRNLGHRFQRRPDSLQKLVRHRHEILGRIARARIC